MEYLTISQTAAKWGLKGRWVTTLCSEDRIPGAKKFGNMWMIPENAEKPADARIKNGNYIGYSRMYQKREQKDGRTVLTVGDTSKTETVDKKGKRYG